MAYKITMANGFSGEHMGLVFVQGEAKTEDEFLATRLANKGYEVIPDTPEPAEETAADAPEQTTKKGNSGGGRGGNSSGKKADTDSRGGG